MNPMKDMFLFLSRQTLLQKMLSTSGPFKIISKRFICGETLEEGTKGICHLNDSGISVTLDHLGESVFLESESLVAVKEYIEMLDCINQKKLNATVSLKLTQMGLDIKEELCLANLRRIMQKAQLHKNKVTIDMESSDYTDITIKIYKRMLQEGFNNAGIVIQSYLRRTEDDIRNMLSFGPRVRLCKGAYKEPKAVAFPKKSDVDKNYIKMLEIMFEKPSLDKGTYPEIATHDEKIINWVLEHAKKNNIPNDKFEFQMLYGIRRDLQDKLNQQGYRMRVYVPYGTHWYPYFMRRLAERPANLVFIMKSMLYR
ncbi:MAG: proline dehydrogenase family protein [Candidatus Brocadiia bacterium]